MCCLCDLSAVMARRWHWAGWRFGNWTLVGGCEPMDFEDDVHYIVVPH